MSTTKTGHVSRLRSASLTIAGFTPTRYNGITVSFVIEPLQKACVNTFYF